MNPSVLIITLSCFSFLPHVAAPRCPHSRGRTCTCIHTEASTDMFCLKGKIRGAWMAQSVECPTSAQVMISRFVSSSPTLGSVLTARSLEPASDSVTPSLSAPPLLVLSSSLSLSLSKINKHKKIKIKVDIAYHFFHIVILNNFILYKKY